VYLLRPAEGAAGSAFLHEIAPSLGDWRSQHDALYDADVIGALRPDDYLARYYERADVQAEAVIAYFGSQTGGFGPHSPRVCLPAFGWTPVERRQRELRSKNGTIAVNEFLIRKEDRTSVVLYWYQTPKRETAGEMKARFWLAVDSIVDRNAEIALVRVTVPVGAAGREEATRQAENFAAELHYDLLRVWRLDK
jgi:EpsI family protein